MTGLELRVESALQRIRRRNHLVRAVLTPLPDAARERARTLDGTLVRGPLHRVPYVLKDVWDVAGVPTTRGSWHYRNDVPERSSAIHVALEDAGAVLVGKSNLSELAMTPESDNTLFGPVCHPRDLTRTSGGSTGGAAAVADGMAAFDWGTDFGGSIRLPSAFCGVVGLRLSASHWAFNEERGLNLLGLNGMGPIGPTVAACRRIVAAVEGRLRTAPKAAFSARGVAVLDVDPFSVGEWSTFRADVEDLVKSAGLDAVPAELPSAHRIDRAFASFLGSHLEEVFRGRLSETVRAAVRSLVLGGLFHAPDMHRHTSAVLSRLLAARVSIYRDRRTARQSMADVRAAAQGIFDQGRLILTPTTTFSAPPHGKALFARGIAAFAKLGNVIDATAIAIPYGSFPNGLPRSIQLLGPPGSEDAVLDVAEKLEGTRSPGAI